MKKFKALYVLGRACLIPVVMFSFASLSKAESFIYQFQPLSIISTAVNLTPEVVAAFRDVSPGKVVLSVNMANSASAFLSDLYFNFDPADNLKGLHFDCLDNPGLANSSVSIGNNTFPLGGYGSYDIHLSFGKPNMKNFVSSSSVSYVISEPGLDASDFAFMAFGGKAPCYAVAGIRGTGSNRYWLGCSSVRLQSVPEPGFIDFMAPVVGAGCLWVRRWRKKSPA